MPWTDPGIEPENTSVARIAKEGGYATAFFGKWGCGGQIYHSVTGESLGPADFADLDFEDPVNYDLFRSLAFSANHHGFEYALELARGVQNGPFAFFENGEWLPLAGDSEFGRVGPEQHLVTNSLPPYSELGDSNWDPRRAGPTLASKAVSYLRTHIAERPSQPFFVYYCSQAIHTPHTPPEKLNETPIAGTTPTAHGDMIVEFDAQVGALVRCLKETETYANTLFIFTSDNGGFSSRNSLSALGHVPAHGLRGSKGSIYEGGTRVPFIVTWPDVIEAGTSCSDPVVAHDIVATIDELASPGLRSKQVNDSLDLLPILTGGESDTSREAILYQAKSKPGEDKLFFWAIRSEQWKLVLTSEDPQASAELTPIALFDLNTNPEEDEAANKLLVDTYAPIAHSLRALFVDLRESGRPTVTTG